jgi:RNA recognition motif-containing protein
VVKGNKDNAKGVGEDRRNLMLKKEGLLNEKEWHH